MRSPLFDAHCHLHAAAFDRDRHLVIERARLRGVQRALCVAEDLDDALRVLAVTARHKDFLRPALGVHPDRAPLLSDGEVGAVEDLIRRHAPSLAAIGEVGLDHRPCWDTRARDRQAEVLRAMVRLGAELGLPLSVHSRGAGRHAVDLLEREGCGAACLHAFDGRAVHAERGAAAGFLFSVPPSVVRSRVKQKWAVRLPAAALLLESDAPVLGPLSDRRNEPANLQVALEEVARLQGCAPEALASRVAANTSRLLPRLSGAPPKDPCPAAVGCYE